MSQTADAIFYLIAFVLVLCAAFGVDARKVGLFQPGMAFFVFVFLAHVFAGIT